MISSLIRKDDRDVTEITVALSWENILVFSFTDDNPLVVFLWPRILVDNISTLLKPHVLRRPFWFIMFLTILKIWLTDTIPACLSANTMIIQICYQIGNHVAQTRLTVTSLSLSLSIIVNLTTTIQFQNCKKKNHWLFNASSISNFDPRSSSFRRWMLFIRSSYFSCIV